MVEFYFKKILEKVDKCNEIIYGERLLVSQGNSVNDNLFKSPRSIPRRLF